MKSSAADPWFYRPELLNRDGFPWSADVSARAAFLSGDVTDRLDLAGYSRARYEETINASPKLPGESPEEARRRAVGYLNTSGSCRRSSTAWTAPACTPV